MISMQAACLGGTTELRSAQLHVEPFVTKTCIRRCSEIRSVEASKQRFLLKAEIACAYDGAILKDSSRIIKNGDEGLIWVGLASKVARSFSTLAKE